MEELGVFRNLVPGWTDAVEILVVAALIYRVLLFLRRTRAMQILAGVVVLILTYWSARLLDFVLLGTLLEAIVQYGAIAAIVVFQPELRFALARMGRARWFDLFRPLANARAADEIAEAVWGLSQARHGAIIAVERGVSLDQYADSGRRVDARVSADILQTIFTPYSPLHDGAVLVAGDHVRTAGAILPLSQSEAGRGLGTRHRAALGLSEETDATVIVISEETARVSIALGGVLEPDVTRDRLREALLGSAELSPGLVRGVA